MRLSRVTTVTELKDCDIFLAQHGPLGGKSASAADAAWVLRCRGRIVGVACSTWRKWRYYYLSTAAIHPEFRGKRLQCRLIQVRLNHARKLSREARTYTHEGNKGSMINLIRCGMHPTLRQDQWVHFSSAQGDPEAG